MGVKCKLWNFSKKPDWIAHKWFTTKFCWQKILVFYHA